MIDDLPPLRDVIARHKLSARKDFGQNFLMDLNLTAKIARLAGDLTACDVLEIGPGPGGLTRGLLAEGARRVVAVEKDKRCIPALEEIKASYPDRLTIIHGDALDLVPSEVLDSPAKVVANLPYNVGTELLIRFLRPDTWPPFWSQLTLMFQAEVANRIVAQPGSKAYGRLSLLSQWRAVPRVAMHLPASAFTPPPKVNSSVVNFERLENAIYPADARQLERVVAAAFNQRRKMLRSSLKLVLADVETVLEGLNIPATKRAEEVSLEDFCAIARAST